jgi:hypothetical protein
MANNVQGIQEFATITNLQNFVLDMTKRKNNGTYVEIGAFHS